MNDRTGVRRRRVLQAVVGAPLIGAAVAGCTADGPGRRVARGSRQDADSRVRWNALRSTQALLSLHSATAAEHDQLAEVLEPVAEHHRQHLDALLSDGPLPHLARLDAVVEPDVPDRAGAALDAVREAERAASEAHIADCLQASTPRLAALLASIAAAEAMHDVVLGES